MSDDNPKNLKCPTCGSTKIRKVDEDKDFVYFWCPFCGGHCWFPKKPENVKIWD